VTAVILVFVPIALLVTIANRIGVGYPIVLVFGGTVIGYIPGAPTIQLPPEFVLVVFLPLLLY
jgi:monovalent cation/hydrogen antiporter